MHTEINFIFRFSVYKFYLISPTLNNWICALMHVNAVVRKRGKTGKYSDPPFFPVFKNLQVLHILPVHLTDPFWIKNLFINCRKTDWLKRGNHYPAGNWEMTFFFIIFLEREISSLKTLLRNARRKKETMIKQNLILLIINLANPFSLYGEDAFLSWTCMTINTFFFTWQKNPLKCKRKYSINPPPLPPPANICKCSSLSRVCLYLFSKYKH